MRMRRKNGMIAVAAIVAFLLLGVTSGWAISPDYLDELRNEGFKNVIVMVPDGCDETVQTLAAWYKKYSGEYDDEELMVDQMQNAAVRIHMANSVITGSAAAATAFATGHKTTVRFLGVGPDEQCEVDADTKDIICKTPHLTGFEPTAEPFAPVASVLEAARMKGMATGIAVTSRVTHATPAAFACHIHDRGMDNEIMEHMVYNNIDVVFGGGKRHLLPGSSCDNAVSGGKRTDCENLLEVLKKRGYDFVDTRDAMMDLEEGPAWGLFNMSHMQPDMDRVHFAPTEPSLAEMVGKAIDLLSSMDDKEGYFLMVEGSQVDWAGHNNDPIYMVKDFIAFDDAVKVACEKAGDDTIVIAFPDHNTGGMKIGHYYTAMGYTETTIEDLVEPLKGMTMSANGVVSFLPETPIAPEKPQGFGGGRWIKYGKAKKAYDAAMAQYYEDVKTTVKDKWGLDITTADVDEILADAPFVGMSYALARVLSKNYTAVGWTTHGHNGETVPVWVYGADAPAGTIDNTALAEMAAAAMNKDLSGLTDALYVELDEGSYVLDETDPENPVVVIDGAKLPVSKDYMIQGDAVIPLPGLTVYAPKTGKVYVPQAALDKL